LAVTGGYFLALFLCLFITYALVEYANTENKKELSELAAISPFFAFFGPWIVRVVFKGLWKNKLNITRQSN